MKGWIFDLIPLLESFNPRTGAWGGGSSVWKQGSAGFVLGSLTDAAADRNDGFLSA